MSKKIWILLIVAILFVVAAGALILHSVLVPDPELTEDQALAIALGHAGLTEEQVSYLNAHLDRDDGRWVYEIEFREGRTEYEYAVNASNGKIVDYDKDRDD
ncbi:MAG: PepSY domain-containing protein [Clostridia bacterium]|nr:PepSY domain-containing protein [Clostridia bacterium]